MCLGIPAKVIQKLSDAEAVVELNGVQYQASLLLVEDVNEEDYVIIHAGFAIQKIDEEEAQITLRLIDEVLNGSAETA
ncbi:MAG: HypC/HybG/HupF family hydrogenase formation chaperone [Armatimonadetes bacterium]|nr:HypC/HybG/HupF family hydrogenase formation chaperone [Armatimonadota bacterium]